MRLFEAIIDANHRAVAGDQDAGLHPTEFESELPLVALTWAVLWLGGPALCRPGRGARRSPRWRGAVGVQWCGGARRCRAGGGVRRRRGSRPPDAGGAAPHLNAT